MLSSNRFKGNISFLNQEVGLKRGKKINVGIPKKIITNLNLLKAFLRGLFDTDGDLKFYRKNKLLPYYPQLRLCMSSARLKKQVTSSLNRLGLRSSTRIDRYGNYETYICGKIQLEKWMNIVGSKNPRTYTKYQVWKKFGFLPAKTKVNDRIKLLNGKKNMGNYAAPVVLQSIKQMARVV